ncbi:hypothetical protein KO361_01785 [Candidatus Woesearchaeota archaeon]|jgi:hypothetical protein|nr:hypothetical protein [Candidatus Woesearchaeota archaeon]
MDLEKLMQKRISRKDFLKSIGFILLALIFFPKKALAFLDKTDNTQIRTEIRQEIKKEIKTELNEKELFKKGIFVNGIKVMEISNK